MSLTLTGLRLSISPTRTVVVEHVDAQQVYYAIHDDASRSPFPVRYRAPIGEWTRYAEGEIAAGRATVLD